MKKSELKHFIKEKILSEIKVNKPRQIWDFNKPHSDFNINNIKVGDILRKKDNKNEIWNFEVIKVGLGEVTTIPQNPKGKVYDTELILTKHDIERWIKKSKLK